MAHRQIGVAVIGCGRMGSLRAGMAAAHPAVRFLGVADKVAGRAETLGQQVAAAVTSTDNFRVIDDDAVDAVIVSTSEPEHREAAVRALLAGKPVLVEKPIALTLADADAMVAAAAKGNTTLHVGYSLRFNRHYLLARDQIAQGKLGRIVTCIGRLYNTRSQGLQILKRSTEATFIHDALTYLVDLFGWFLGDVRPVEVMARSHGVVYRDLGYDADEAAAAIVSYEDGAIVNLGLGYALPANYPTHGRLIRAEILGEKGVLMFDDDHKENISFTEDGSTHAYVGHSMQMAFLTSNASGNWALGKYWGPLGDETRAWLDHLATGAPCPNTTGAEARRTLEVTTAIERAAHSNGPVTLPLSESI